MENPKMIILSDGFSTQVVVDDVLIGKGIGRLEFSTKDETGEQRATIKIIELNLESVEMRKAAGLTEKILHNISGRT